MAKSFKILRAKMSPEARKRAEQKTQELLQEIERLEKETGNASFDNQEYESRPPPSTLGGSIIVFCSEILSTADC